MKLKPNPILSELSNIFLKAGERLYVVGGNVRNALLSLTSNDIDICSCIHPEKLIKIMGNHPNIKIIPKAIEYGTVEIHIKNKNSKNIFEYTVFRKDHYNESGKHRPNEISFTNSLEEDAFRRDFTINALYSDCITGQIIDPTGGLKDLEKKQLRTCSYDADAIMQNDGLRALRLIRFCGELGFNIESSTYESAKKYSYLLKDISSERKWQELQKILLCDIKYNIVTNALPAHERALHLLIDMNMMQYIFPELLHGKDILQKKEYHAFDVLGHNIRTCGYSEPRLIPRLAALLHDVGKPKVYKETGRMLHHDIEGALIAKKMLHRLKVDKNSTQRVCMLIKKHMMDLNNNAKNTTLKKQFAIMGLETSYEFASLREADFLGSGKQIRPIKSAERYRQLLQKMEQDRTPFSINELKISGNEIQSILREKPSSYIGQVKHYLWMHCAIRPYDNNLTRLKKICKKYIRKVKF